MSEPKRTLDLAGAAGCEDNDDGRQTLDEGVLTEAQVAELAELYREKIGSSIPTDPTERLSEKEIQAAVKLAGPQSGAADVDGHRFDTGTEFDHTDEIVLPGLGYGNYLKFGGVALLAVLGLCAYIFRAEIADVIGWQETMDGLLEPKKLSPEEFKQMLGWQLDKYSELASLKKNNGLNELLLKMRLDLCPDEQINSMIPQHVAMLKGYGFVGMEMLKADCANGKAEKNLVLIMSDTTSVEFRFEGEENAVKISSMVASGGARCTVDLGEELLISCPAKDGMEAFRVYVGNESCVQKMIVGYNAYTYTMSDGQCVKVDVSGWTEVPETPAKAVEPSNDDKQKKQGDGVKAKVGTGKPKETKPKNDVCGQIRNYEFMKDVKLPPDFENQCSRKLKTANDCRGAAMELCGPDRLGISLCRVGVEEKCKKIFHEINPMLPR